MLSDPKKHRVVGVLERATIRPESLSWFFYCCACSRPVTHLCFCDRFMLVQAAHKCCMRKTYVCCLQTCVCVCVCVDNESAKMYIYILHHTNMSIVATHMYKPSFVDPRDALETSSLRKVASAARRK